jgi:hypothetical protein
MLLSTYSVDVIMNSEQVQATFALPTEDEFQVSGEEGLGDRAARKGLKYGTFPHYFYDQFGNVTYLSQDFTGRKPILSAIASILLPPIISPSLPLITDFHFVVIH